MRKITPILGKLPSIRILPSTILRFKSISTSSISPIRSFSSFSNFNPIRQQLVASVSQLRTIEDEIEDGFALEEEQELEDEDDTLQVEPKSIVFGTGPIFLRPYQLDCEEHCLAALRDTSEVTYSRIGVSAPTGSGKTAIFTSLIRRLAPLIHPELDSLATQVLVLVGSIELARQAADTCRRTWPDLSVEIEQGSKNVASGHADVTIATYQTLARSDFSRLHKFDPNRFKAVIVDEAHHAAAKSYLSILSYFDSRVDGPIPNSVYDEAELVNRPIASKDDISHSNQSTELLPVEEPRLAKFDAEGNSCVPIIGFTATFGRADGLSLGKIFERIVWSGNWLEMIKGKWLSELRFTTIVIKALDLSSVKVSDGDFSPTALAAIVDQSVIRDEVVQAWQDKASHDCQSTLVFAVNVKHIISLTQSFRDIGVDARFVHQGTPPKVRAETLRAFKNLEFPVLVNCGILTEGADFPAIDCVLLGRPTKSQNLFLQMIGRGLRLFPGKENCLILDLVDNTHHGLVCAPTLFGIDPDDVIENTTTQALQEKEKLYELSLMTAAIAHRAATENANLNYKDYASVFDFVEERNLSDESNAVKGINLVHAGSVSRFAWVGCGAGVYVLSLPPLGHLKITPTDDEPPKFEAKLYKKLPNGNGFYPPTFLGRHFSLSTLIRKVDADIVNHPDLQSGPDLKKNATWRQAPASIGQKNLILTKLFTKEQQLSSIYELDSKGGLTESLTPAEKLAKGDQVWIPADYVGKKGEEVDLNQLTKGQASDVLTRVVHGGVAFLKKVKKAEAREQKKRLK